MREIALECIQIFYSEISNNIFHLKHTIIIVNLTGANNEKGEILILTSFFAIFDEIYDILPFLINYCSYLLN